MAINSLDSSCDKLICKSDASSTSSKARAGDLPSCRLLKINFATESAVSKRGRKKNSNSNSPYLNDDSFHLLSQVTEKTIFRKKDTMFFSSFPLAANIYKANSDECESLKKTTKKAKKSVLTLPNYQADPVHQICTDGDINYSEDDNQDKVRQKIKRRNPVPRNQKSRPEGRYYELYDRNAGHGFPMELVDYSSIETIQDYASKRRKAKPKSVVGSKQKAEQKPNPHDVWSLLRNLNRFQFSQSPSTSTDSDVFPTMGTTTKRRNNRKDKLVAETCRTEQFAYSSSFEVDGSFSRSSSFDRITVINKQSEFSKICKNFEKRIAKTKSFLRNANNKLQNRNQNSKAVTNTTNTLKANTKSITHKLNNSRALPLEYNSNKQRYNNCGEGDTKKNAVKRNSDSPAFDCTQTEFQNPLYNETNDSQFPTEIVETNNNQELIYTDSTGFSKGAAKKEIISKGVPDRTVLSTVSSSEDHNTFKGIIKVVLSKGSTIPPPKRNGFPTRKRQPSIVPSHSAASKYISSTVSPKLTQTDIKRRLALLKFPIVVLGKDQLSSTHEVLNLEPTQFNGLNERVWPFMEQWQNGDSYKLENKLKKKNDNSNKKITREILELNKSQKIHRGLTSSKQLNEYRKNTDNAKNYNKGKMEKKRITLPAELQQHAQPKNIKPILQFKENILKLLYKKSSIPNFVAENNKINEYSDVKTKPAYKTTCKKLDTSTDTHLKNGGYSDVKTKPAHKITSSKVDTSTQMDTIGGYSKVKTKSATKVTGNKADTRTDTHLMSSRNDISGNPINSPVTVKDTKKMRCTKEPCAKARWVSDFIDNVIRKIKNGVYYNHDSKLPNQKHGFEYKEAEIETVATNNKNQDDQQISKIGTNKTESVTIPGFDDNILPALEIQTMNTSEISVKHCVTNIMVHFNVAMPNDPVINTNRSSLISLDKTEGQTKIFNCKTFLINAMLPAELCSILPKMMCNIIKETETLELAPVPVQKYPSHLSIIAEVINTEMPEPFKLPLFGHLRMTPELQKLITGVYPNKPRPKLDKTYYAKYDRCLSEKLLPRLSRSYLFDFVAQPTSTLENYFPKWTFLAPAPVKDITCRNQLNTCMALQPYPASNRRLVPALNKQLDLAGFLRRMSSYIASCSRVFNYFFDNNITVNLTTTNTQGLEDRFSIMVSSLMKNDNENASEKLVSDIFTIVNNKHLPAIQCIELKSPSSKLLQKRAPANNKTKKKSFINLYRKFKSTSNIFGGRTSTSLSQITNTDEFLQALGTPKLFAEIFDSTYGLRILSSLKEMTCWITDITPTQALLVLLLVNKKDTSSLVRFRPVLLQGIAVNRITRASELDMEIEVIEREQLNGLSQPEGISYLPASAENRDNLLEELYWIAKTTASDYQRTFDESSEKLLKSLLEKRKKLNPSYLRVMARYVGLGLLKPPIKK